MRSGFPFGFNGYRDQILADGSWAITRSYLYDGINDVSNFGDILDYVAGNFTFTFWIKPAVVSSTNYVLANGAYNSRGYHIYLSNPGRIGVYTNQSGASQTTYSANNTIVANTWQHIIVEREGAAVRIYKNNVEVSYGAQGTHVNPQAFTFEFRLGCYANAIHAESGHYTGYMTDFRVYPKLLTAGEKTAVYGQTEVAGYDAWWKMEEESGAVANDSSANEYNGDNENITEGTFYTSEVPA